MSNTFPAQVRIEYCAGRSRIRVGMPGGGGRRGVAFIQEVEGDVRGDRQALDKGANRARLLALLAGKQQRQPDDQVGNAALREQREHLRTELLVRRVMQRRERDGDTRRSTGKRHPRSPVPYIESQECAHRTYCAREATRRATSDFFRAALRGWMMFFLAAISIAL